MSEDSCEKAVYPFTVVIDTLSPNTAYSFPGALAKTVIFCDVVGKEATVLQTVLYGFGSPQTNFFTTDIID
jgi:hypothetical protein